MRNLEIEKMAKIINTCFMHFNGKKITKQRAINIANKIKKYGVNKAQIWNLPTEVGYALCDIFDDDCKKVEFSTKNYLKKITKEGANKLYRNCKVTDSYYSKNNPVEKEKTYDISHLNIKDKNISDMLQELLNDYSNALKFEHKGQSPVILEGARSMLNKFSKYHNLGVNLTAIVDGHYEF